MHVLDIQAWTLPPLGYVGFGPGQEFIPYFWALLTFVIGAIVAVLQWPLIRLRQAIRRRRGSPASAPAATPPAETPEVPK